MAGPSVVVEMTGSEARLWRAQQKIIDQQVAMERGYQRVGGASSQAGREGERSGKQATSGWDTGPLKEFAAVLGGLAGGLTVAGAFRGIVNLAREAQEEIKAVGEELHEAADGMKYLWQVSEGKRGYEELAGRYKLGMAQEGIGREAAADLVFQLKSFDEMESFEAVTRSHRFMKADVAAQYIARLRAPTAWGKEIATPEQALSGLIAGAEKSGFNVDVTADWFARTAAQARAMGASPAEVLGVGAAVSPSFTEGTLQATAMQRLVSDLASWRDKTLIAAEEKPPKTLDREATEQYAELQRKAEAIRGTKGLLATFDLYRELEPTEYQLKKADNVRFRRIAESLEGAYEKARLLTGEIQREFDTGEAYQRKIAERPPELTIQQQRDKAAAQLSVALEPLALKQTQLETLIEQSKTLAGVTGTPITIEKGWERALQAEATVGLIDQATQQVASRLLNRIAQTSPEVAEEFLAPRFRRRAEVPSGLALDPYAAAAGRRPSLGGFAVPDEMLPEQTAAIEDAMTAIMETEIGGRPFQARLAEQASRKRQYAEAFVTRDSELADWLYHGERDEPEPKPGRWAPRPYRRPLTEPSPGPADAKATGLEPSPPAPLSQPPPVVAPSGDLTINEAARDLSRAAQDLQPAVDGLNRLVDRLGSRDPLLGIGLGEDR